ncbi:hypothetical protein ANN_20410 [Periplaneta americana]|uniref:Reverse transcriptase domain-containing protein n=1 Tax=Periplaneta americana TaxID=6978 RepID=A0ABQ8SDP2_PERAM|nr:hypothetical protein ANN_20410 [Periplaneta americana]
MATSEDNLQRLVYNFNQMAESFNMEISTDNSKVMAFLGKEPVRSKIFINNKIIEQVKNFRYLGYQTSYEEEKDLNEKIIKFNRAIINQIFKPTLVQKHTRTRIYKTLARPILCFGSEAWTIRNIDSQRLTAAEMRFMRRTAGYTRMDHIRNFDIMKELQIEPITRCDEQETLPHVLGFCHHGELLRINRHNTVSSFIGASIRQNASYEVYEEIGCVSSDGSTRRADIIIINRQKDKGVILDPTIRSEMHEQQPQENIVRNGTIKVGDLSLEEVEKFKYLGATVTNINDTREEIKRRINMGNACYYTLEKLLSSSLLSKNLKVRIYKTVILPVILYACETWNLTLRQEQRLRVFENKVLTKIFGAKRDEVTGEWRKLHNTELHALYSSPDIIRNIKYRRLRWAGHVARMGESRNAYRVLVGRPEV